MEKNDENVKIFLKCTKERNEEEINEEEVNWYLCVCKQDLPTAIAFYICRKVLLLKLYGSSLIMTWMFRDMGIEAIKREFKEFPDIKLNAEHFKEQLKNAPEDVLQEIKKYEKEKDIKN